MSVTQVCDTTKRDTTSLEMILERSRSLLHRLHLASNNIQEVSNRLEIHEDVVEDSACEKTNEIIPQFNNVLDGFEINISKIEWYINHIQKHV